MLPMFFLSQSKRIVSLSQWIGKFLHIYLTLDIIMIAVHSLTVFWPFLKLKFPPPWIQSQRLHPPKALTVHMPFFRCFSLLVLFLLIFRNIPLHLMHLMHPSSAQRKPHQCLIDGAKQLWLLPSLGFMSATAVRPAPELPDQPSRRQGAGRSAERPGGRQPGVAAPTRACTVVLHHAGYRCVWDTSDGARSSCPPKRHGGQSTGLFAVCSRWLC